MTSLLTRLSRRLQGFSHQQALARLKTAFEFTPATIYDIGAYHGNWTRLARRIFPTSQYFLFEANPEHSSVLQSTGERYFVAALGEKDGVPADFYTARNASATGASFFMEQTIHYQGSNLRVVPLTTRRLDVLVNEYGLPSPDLIKLDVQGSELAVLRGAGQLLNSCGAVVAELSFVQGNKGAPLASEVMHGLHHLGFEPVDICKIRRGAPGNPVQADILFASRTLFQKYWKAAGLM